MCVHVCRSVTEPPNRRTYASVLPATRQLSDQFLIIAPLGHTTHLMPIRERIHLQWRRRANGAPTRQAAFGGGARVELCRDEGGGGEKEREEEEGREGVEAEHRRTSQ